MSTTNPLFSSASFTKQWRRMMEFKDPTHPTNFASTLDLNRGFPKMGRFVKFYNLILQPVLEKQLQGCQLSVTPLDTTKTATVSRCHSISLYSMIFKIRRFYLEPKNCYWNNVTEADRPVRHEIWTPIYTSWRNALDLRIWAEKKGGKSAWDRWRIWRLGVNYQEAFVALKNSEAVVM